MDTTVTGVRDSIAQSNVHRLFNVLHATLTEEAKALQENRQRTSEEMEQIRVQVDALHHDYANLRG